MQLVLSSITPLAPDVSTFSFTTPVGTSWLAGQSIRIELPSGEERRFSISSHPGSKKIDITTRRSQSFFKQELWQLREGNNVQGFNIEGSFVWQEHQTSHIFITGGIGITPFIAMMQEASDRLVELWYITNDKHPLFLEQLEEWGRVNNNFSFQIVKPLDLRQVIKDNSLDSLFYVSGPQKFVEEISDKLQNYHGVLQDNIIKDLFTGNIKA